MHADTHTHTGARTHTHTHTHARRHTHTHRHARTHKLKLKVKVSGPDAEMYGLPVRIPDLWTAREPIRMQEVTRPYNTVIPTLKLLSVFIYKRQDLF